MKIAPDFNSSFNQEFCLHLEYHLCRTFDNSSRDDVRGFWCDGVSWAPFFNNEVNRQHLSIEKVLREKRIETRAYLGSSGQDIYEMLIALGKNALNNYQNGMSLLDCIPSEETMDWIEIDIENRNIKLQLR